jgi:hypothetical protein
MQKAIENDDAKTSALPFDDFHRTPRVVERGGAQFEVWRVDLVLEDQFPDVVVTGCITP